MNDLRTALKRGLVLTAALAASLVIAACGAAAATPTVQPEQSPAPPAAMPDGSMEKDAMGDDGMQDGQMMDDKMDDGAMTGEGMDDGSMSDDAMMGGQELPLVSGWYRDQPVRYYDFGMNSATNGGAVATAPIYVFVHGMDAEGNPRFVEGQHNIVDVRPGDTGYSDLWQVMLVTVPEDYTPDSITSVGQLMGMGYEITPTDMLVNCPIVEDGTTLEGGEALVQGWYRGEEVYYPDFGLNPAAAIPIWAFITGMDSEGAPQFVEGQQNVIDAVPTDAGYSAFWRVNLVVVPEGYVPNSVRSRADLDAMGYEVVQTGMVVNCPVTEFPGA